MGYTESTFENLNPNEPADADSISTAAPAIRQIKNFLWNTDKSSTGFKGILREFMSEFFYDHWLNQLYPVGSVIATMDNSFDPNVQFSSDDFKSTQVWEVIEGGNFIRAGHTSVNYRDPGLSTIDPDTKGGERSVLTELEWTGVYIKNTNGLTTNFMDDTTKVCAQEIKKLTSTTTTTNKLFPPYITIIFWKRIS